MSKSRARSNSKYWNELGYQIWWFYKNLSYPRQNGWGFSQKPKVCTYRCMSCVVCGNFQVGNIIYEDSPGQFWCRSWMLTCNASVDILRYLKRTRVLPIGERRTLAWEIGYKHLLNHITLEMEFSLYVKDFRILK